MKSMAVTPTGRALSRSSASATAIQERSDGGKGAESFYYPGCLKDTNCICEICVASINATLDLIPSGSSIQQESSLTKLSAFTTSTAPRGWAPPVSSPSRTPAVSETGSEPASPPLRSTAKSRPSAKKDAQKRGLCDGNFCFLRCGFALCLILAVDYGIPPLVQEILGSPSLTAEVVKIAGERSHIAGNLREKFGFLKKSFGGIVGTERVSNCSDAANWGFHQEGHLFRATCVMYKSAMEEVIIWGCPLQASGWLTTGFYSRWFTVLSGKITEWSAENLSFIPRPSNSSWVYNKWTTTAIHLDPNTWVLEYQRSSLKQNSRILPLLWEFFKIKLSKKMEELQHGSPLWFKASRNFKTYVEESLPHPT